MNSLNEKWVARTPDLACAIVACLLALTTGCGRSGFEGTGVGGAEPSFPVGTILSREAFLDGDVASRGWYDTDVVDVVVDPTTPGSGSAFHCRFQGGACVNGRPGRLAFPAADSVYVSYWIRYSSDFEGATEVFFHTDVDGPHVGPASSHLSINVGSEAGAVRFRFEDNENVDPACVRTSNDVVTGCTGYTFDTYPFGEERSVCACNGIVGELDEAACFAGGGSRWFSYRYWYSSAPAFATGPPHSFDDWHFVEIYLRMNTIAGGIGVPNGSIGYARDGEVLIRSDEILMHTAEYPTMRFSHVMLNPVYGADGDELWVTDFTVATGN